MTKVNLSFDIDPHQAFEILLQTLDVKLSKDNLPNFVVKDGEIIVDNFDDKGELYLALYHLATKIFPNTEFRSIFDDPNVLMSKLYLDKEET